MDYKMQHFGSHDALSGKHPGFAALDHAPISRVSFGIECQSITVAGTPWCTLSLAAWPHDCTIQQAINMSEFESGQPNFFWVHLFD